MPVRYLQLIGYRICSCYATKEDGISSVVAIESIPRQSRVIGSPPPV